MKKIVFSLMLVAVFALVVGGVQAAYAQGPAVPGGPGVGAGNGAGMMNGRGFRGAQAGVTASGGQAGFLHDELVAVYADKLGLSVEDLEARLAAGETLSQVALAQGLTFEEFFALRAEARAQALDQAVADGDLTQAQAVWMKTRGMGRSGGYGLGSGAAGNPDCPYYTPAAP
jgi:hypothetical protein